MEFYVEKRAKELVKQGKKVTCYVRSWATPLQTKEYQGIQFIHILTINTKHLDAPIHSLLSTIHSQFSSVDTIWYQASGPALFSFIPKLFGKKVIVTIHTLEWQRDKWGPVARLVLKLGEAIGVWSANVVVAVSDDLGCYIKEKYHKDAIIDPPMVERVKKIKPDIITQKYGLQGNDYILYMGRFVPEKRIEWLIKAYREIEPKGIKLVLAGGSSHAEEYEQMLRNLTMNDKRLTTNIIFTGYVFGREKQELLTNCKLFVLSSSLEGSPVVLFELPTNTDRVIYDGESYAEFLFALKRIGC